MNDKPPLADKLTIENNIAWVTPLLGREGKLMYLGPLLAALSQRCRDFCVITADYKGPVNEAPFKITIASNVKRLYWKARDKNVKGFTIIGPSFRRVLSSSNAEVLFLVEFSLTTLYGVLLQYTGRPVRTVLVMESIPLPNEGAILGFARNFLRKFVVKRVDAILTNNRAGREFLENSLGANPGRIVSKPYLVSKIDWQESLHQPGPGKYSTLDNSSVIRFLFVGRLIPRKGLQHLIAAVSLLPEELQRRIHIDLVGEGDFHSYGEGNYRAHLENLVRESNLEGTFDFLGKMEYKALHKVYSSAHVFIFPTLRDYRALSPFEALDAGLPIVSSIHDGGVTENVAEGENGFSCDPRDHKQLAAILETILDNPEQLAQFSRKSMEMAENYTIESAVNNMISAAQLAIK